MEVLRAELAEERERSHAVVTEDPDAAEAPRDVTAVHRLPFARPPPPSTGRARVTTPPAAAVPTHWIAVGALVLFAFVLLGLLAGFLG